MEGKEDEEIKTR